MTQSDLPLLRCVQCNWTGDVTQTGKKDDEFGLPWDVCPLCASDVEIIESSKKTQAKLKVKFKIKAKDPENYYSVDGITFSEDDLLGAFAEITQDQDLATLCNFLAEEWPLKYGEAVNLMITEGYYPENFEEDKAELQELYNEDLFYALCKYPLSGTSYFSDQFSGGTPEADSMLEEVCNFVNES